MRGDRTLWYLGNDEDLRQRLSETLLPQGVDVARAAGAAEAFRSGEADWYRVLLIDGNVSEPPLFDSVHAMRQRSAAVPLIVVAPDGDRRLTQVAVARQFGAEAILFKPLDDLAPLVEVIAAAFKRLDGWQRTLGQLPAYLCTPSAKRLPPELPLTNMPEESLRL